MRRPLLAVLLLACSSVANAAPELVPVTACGQVVPRGAVGYLTADLDCTGFDAMSAAVFLSRGARLDLAGFTITGANFGVICGELATPNGGTIDSKGKCRVVGGGGAIVNSEAHGILANAITVTNLAIQDVGQEGIHAAGTVKFTDVTITNSGTNGAHFSRGAKLTATTITDSAENGILANRRVVLVDSTVTGSGSNPAECDGPPCADIRSTRKPTVKNSTCETSARPDPPFTWNVCALD
jgi:hypothetical protein